jgi:hypothetical protein
MFLPKNKNGYTQAFVLAVVFGIGCAVGSMCTPQDVAPEVEKSQPNTISSVVESKTKTDITYVPKTAVNGKKEKTDLQADIGKTDFVVRVNGQEQTFTKVEDERYVFDKNKLTLDQTSKVTMDINVPTWDKTKRWAVGVGYGNDGMAYTVDFPIGKSNAVGGWVYRDDDSTAVGVKIKF